MRRFIALMLALCMALAAIPALAETDLSGTWYLIILGMNVGTFELNADGTCVCTTSSSGEEKKLEGTWSADGDTVTLVIQEQPMPMTFDGTDLIPGEEAIATFGGDSLSAGMDLSMLSSLLRFSREPGLVTADEYDAYVENGTIPEGKTEADMKAAQEQVMMLFMSMASALGGDIGTSGGEQVPAPELSVVEDNFYVRKSFGDRLEGYYIAKVKNENDAPMTISGAVLVLKDADGNEVGRSEFLARCGSTYLEPGETSFVSVRADAEEGKGAPVAYEISFETSANSYNRDTQIEAFNAELRINEDYWTRYFAAATITNATDAPMSQASVVIALKDKDGKMLDLATAGLYQNELAAGSTITLIDIIDSTTVDYCTENGIQLGDVEAFGWVESQE